MTTWEQIKSGDVISFGKATRYENITVKSISIDGWTVNIENADGQTISTSTLLAVTIEEPSAEKEDSTVAKTPPTLTEITERVGMELTQEHIDRAVVAIKRERPAAAEKVLHYTYLTPMKNDYSNKIGVMHSIWIRWLLDKGSETESDEWPALLSAIYEGYFSWDKFVAALEEGVIPRIDPRPAPSPTPVKLTESQLEAIRNAQDKLGEKNRSATIKRLLAIGMQQSGLEFPPDENTWGGKRAKKGTTDDPAKP
jgi:hypothetical protein